MPTTVRFESKTEVVPFGDSSIIYESITPVLAPEERAKRKREIETMLFEVFIKYTDKKRLFAKCVN